MLLIRDGKQKNTTHHAIPSLQVGPCSTPNLGFKSWIMNYDSYNPQYIGCTVPISQIPCKK